MRALAWMLAAVVVAACGIATSARLGGSSGFSCANVPVGACEQQAELVTAGLNGVTDISLECRAAPPCTRAEGAGVATITLANGQTVKRPWSYVGVQGAPPLTSCVKVAQAPCQDQVETALDGVPPSDRVVSVTVTCASPSCGDTGGSATTRLVMADGSIRETGTSWGPQP